MSAEIKLTPTASYFELAGPYPVTGRSWGTASECKAACLLVHGLGAHSGWFEAIGRRLKVRSIYAMAFDQLGFGQRRSQTFTSRQQWLSDLAKVYRYLQYEVGDKPIYLLGNSAGSLMVLSKARELNPAGVAITSPGFEGCMRTFTLVYRLKGILTALFQPDSDIELPYTTEMVTRDDDVRRWIENDPLRRFAFPSRMLWEILMLSRQVQSELHLLTMPLLMLTAGIEHVVDNKVADSMFERLGSTSKTKRQFPEAWHDLMFDPAIDEVVEALTEWMAECSPEKILAG